MNASPRHAWTIFCEDIRQEVGNKNSFMGIYNGEMIFDEFPSYLPKLCVISFCETEVSNLLKTLSCKVFLNENLLQEQTLPSEHLLQSQQALMGRGSEEDPILKITFGVNFQFLGMQFEKPSIIKVIIYADEEEIVAGKLRVKVNPDKPNT